MIDLTNGYKYNKTFFTELDGKAIDRTIAGFQTLTVNGRENVEINNNVIESNSINGGVFVNSTIKSKEIDVVFKIYDSDVLRLNDKIKRLKALLYKKNTERLLRFPDEAGNRYVYFVSIDNVESYVNSIIGVIKFVQLDPLMYGKLITVEAENMLKFDDYYLNNVKIDEVEITPRTSGNSLKLTNTRTGDYLQIKDSITSGAVYKFYPKQQLVTKNNADIRSKLDIRSELENFPLIYNDELSCNINAKIKITLREFWL